MNSDLPTKQVRRALVVVVAFAAPSSKWLRFNERDSDERLPFQKTQTGSPLVRTDC